MDSLDEFVSTAPRPQRLAMRLLIALTTRPQGRALLARANAANQLAQMLTSLGRYDAAAAAIFATYPLVVVLGVGASAQPSSCW